ENINLQLRLEEIQKKSYDAAVTLDARLLEIQTIEKKIEDLEFEVSTRQEEFEYSIREQKEIVEEWEQKVIQQRAVAKRTKEESDEKIRRMVIDIEEHKKAESE